MSSKLWSKNAGASLRPIVDNYTVGNDWQLDNQLLGYDITATKAHVTMLGSIKVLDEKETTLLLSALEDLQALWQGGNFIVTSDDEDGHTAIENWLTAKLGSVGKKVHTGRSRNDQALVMMRLYLKDKLAEIAKSLAACTHSFEIAAEKAQAVPMPGYTHMQKAMPASVGMWLGSFAAALKDQSAYIVGVKNVIDQNPLGSSAGFGNSLPLDKEQTTTLLGFAKTQDNPMYCGMSRGLFELMAVQAVTPLMTISGKFAEDMMLFTMQEFEFFSLPDNMTTGSSIMPHKHNYDLFEIMRGHAHTFSAHSQKLHAICSGVISGYNRDLQLTKPIVIEAFDTALATLEVLALAVDNMQVNGAKLSAAMTPEMQSVAHINALVGQGVPFRDAYKIVKEKL